jgi:hypothetical protein
MELVLSGAPIGASEAERIGLVNRVVPAAELMTEARKLAGQLAVSAPIAMRYIIHAINKGLEMPFAEASVFEATLFGLIASTDDMREGTKAFLEKRKAEFKESSAAARARRWKESASRAARERAGGPASIGWSGRSVRQVACTPSKARSRLPGSGSRSSYRSTTIS